MSSWYSAAELYAPYTGQKYRRGIEKGTVGASIQDGKFVVIRGLSDRYNSGNVINSMPS
ncbi:MAG: hypothetical protein V9F01_16920 [Chitinophagaceae bacterium]